MDWSFGAAIRTGTGSDRESSIKNKDGDTRNSMIRATRLENGRASSMGLANDRELEEVGNGSPKGRQVCYIAGIDACYGVREMSSPEVGKVGQDMGERK